MPKFLLLLVVTLIFIGSGDALSPPTIGSNLSKLKSSNDIIRTVSTGVGDQRMLRSNKEEDNATTEERGLSGATLKSWAQQLGTWTKNSKLGQAAAKLIQKLAQKKRDVQVSRLIKKGSSDTVLVQNKVTPDEYFKAKGLSPSLKDQASSPSLWKEHPGLRQYFTYKSYWDGKQVSTAA